MSTADFRAYLESCLPKWTVLEVWIDGDAIFAWIESPYGNKLKISKE